MKMFNCSCYILLKFYIFYVSDKAFISSSRLKILIVNIKDAMKILNLEATKSGGNCYHLNAATI